MAAELKIYDAATRRWYDRTGPHPATVDVVAHWYSWYHPLPWREQPTCAIALPESIYVDGRFVPSEYFQQPDVPCGAGYDLLERLWPRLVSVASEFDVRVSVVANSVCYNIVVSTTDLLETEAVFADNGALLSYFESHPAENGLDHGKTQRIPLSLTATDEQIAVWLDHWRVAITTDHDYVRRAARRDRLIARQRLALYERGELVGVDHTGAPLHAPHPTEVDALRDIVARAPDYF